MNSIESPGHGHSNDHRSDWSGYGSPGFRGDGMDRSFISVGIPFLTVHAIHLARKAALPVYLPRGRLSRKALLREQREKQRREAFGG